MSDSPREKSIRRELSDMVTLGAAIAMLHVMICNNTDSMRSVVAGFTLDLDMRKFLYEFFDGARDALENNFLEYVVQLQNRIVLLDAELAAISKDDAVDCDRI